MRYVELPHPQRVDLPIIYMWEIRASDGSLIGRYVGKAKGGVNRPRTYHSSNVASTLSGKPYQKNNPKGHRRVHLALAEAERRALCITLQFLCNVLPSENIDKVEQRHIREYRSQGEDAWQFNG